MMWKYPIVPQISASIACWFLNFSFFNQWTHLQNLYAEKIYPPASKASGEFRIFIGLVVFSGRPPVCDIFC